MAILFISLFLCTLVMPICNGCRNKQLKNKIEEARIILLPLSQSIDDFYNILETTDHSNTYELRGDTSKFKIIAIINHKTLNLFGKTPVTYKIWITEDGIIVMSMSSLK